MHIVKIKTCYPALTEKHIFKAFVSLQSLTATDWAPLSLIMFFCLPFLHLLLVTYVLLDSFKNTEPGLQIEIGVIF